MSRRVLAAPFALALLAAPALAQTAGAPGTPGTYPRALPGTSGVNAVPDTGQESASGSGRGAPVNNPDSGRSGPRGAGSPTGTGTLEGGGGPNGPASATPKPQAGAAPAAPLMLAQADIQAQSPGMTQQPGTMPPPPPPPPGGSGATGARVQQQLRDLYARLRITPAQQPQWNAFAGTLEGNAQHMMQLWSSRRATASALDDMRNYAGIAQAHAEDMQRLVAAFTPLYASLSPQQKLAADQAFQQAAQQATMRNGRPRALPR